MPYEVYTVPTNTGQPSFVGRIYEGDTGAVLSYPDDDVYAVVARCAEDESEVKIYGRIIGKSDEPHIEVEKEEIMQDEHLLGQATPDEPYDQELIDSEGTRTRFLVRYVGKSAAQTEFEIFGEGAPTVRISPN